MAGKINKTGYTIINGMKLPAAAASYKIDYVLLKKLLKYRSDLDNPQDDLEKQKCLSFLI